MPQKRTHESEILGFVPGLTSKGSGIQIIYVPVSEESIRSWASSTVALKTSADVEPRPSLDEEVETLKRIVDVVGYDQLARWLSTAVPSLGGRTPFSLLSTAEGRLEIEKTLIAIEHGVY